MTATQTTTVFAIRDGADGPYLRQMPYVAPGPWHNGRRQDRAVWAYWPSDARTWVTNEAAVRNMRRLLETHPRAQVVRVDADPGARNQAHQGQRVD